MNNDKCFCHFNGFAVKDAFAREKLTSLEVQVENAFQEAANVSGTAANARDAAQNAETIANDAHAYAMNAENASLAAIYKADEALNAAQNISGLLIESTEHPGCFYRNIGGEIEWVNPPMVFDTEYRTTERFNGAPVYIKSLKIIHTDSSIAISSDSFRISPKNVVDFFGTAYSTEYAIKIFNHTCLNTGEVSNSIELFYDNGFCLWVNEEMVIKGETNLPDEYYSVVTFKYIKGD